MNDKPVSLKNERNWPWKSDPGVLLTVPSSVPPVSLDFSEVCSTYYTSRAENAEPADLDQSVAVKTLFYV